MCTKTLMLSNLRLYLTPGQYKKLIQIENNQLFHQEQLLLPSTQKYILHQKRLLEIEITHAQLLQLDISEANISTILSDLGYTLDPSFCPQCRKIIQNQSCSTCSIRVCETCFQPIQDSPPHTCHDFSMQFIAKHCHPCPQCQSWIEKEDNGCDQMFCTQCFTTFSWATLSIASEDDVHHNPHYYEWKRNQSDLTRHMRDNPCKGPFYIQCEQGQHMNYRYFTAAHDIIDNYLDKMDEFYEHYPLYRQYYRIRYLYNQLSLKQWRRKFIMILNIQRHHHDIKVVFILFLECLYYIVLTHGPNDVMLKDLASIISHHLQLLQSAMKMDKDYFQLNQTIFVGLG